LSTYTIIRDVGESLRKLLRDNIKPELSKEDSITFDSPADIESPTTPKLSIFLYKTTENAYLRNSPPESVGNTQMRRPPIVFDLHYVFTPYAKDREAETIILEKLMQTLYDNPVFRGDNLQGNLKGLKDQEIRIVYNNLTTDELNKLWSIFPNKALKLSTSYILTPVRIPSSSIKDITRVGEYSIGGNG